MRVIPENRGQRKLQCMGYDLLCIADIHIPEESESRVFSRRIKLVCTVLSRTKDSVKPVNKRCSTHGYELGCHLCSDTHVSSISSFETDLP
jgi:hypothetical protein